MVRIVSLFLFVALLLPNCLSEKTCSNQDRSCSLEANLASILFSPPGIYLYSTLNTYQGNLANSIVLDTNLSIICTNERLFAPITSSCSNLAPFVSTSFAPMSAITGFYIDFPTTGVPLRGPFGTILADDFNSVFTTDLKSTMSDAGLGTGLFWTFGDANGGYGGTTATTCADGTDNTTGTGAAGSPLNSASTTWFGSSLVNCVDTYRLLCMCYSPASGGGG
ncbi:hypothetical protein EHQ27_19275 [Leptospira wolffii]|uniref:hypothetical protein n=1 Tax=Leptospira wolffii TaxID=409998 RepID=UPI0002DE3705|nr:hypothetical protein [Leptospira wolffii]EPG64383.1 hypothetical protein LEP1GSC061_3787 [Leptospira wolffii serovar Khorat str. Khorat-H2]TGK62686.1 hypothetical protein EHQ32_07715 [Leptospira wolffii]TGK65660.1 hypothetical protein EHQ27_19275 [Leptospira wolffii]TGK73927.1 hypothetical protein EHQ35_06050 [Leptospira wolffii]TGL28789.1 hypothetical protein EHQ57_12575 [Leptospira wolffii]